jgi:hypothetical protein
LLPLLAFVLAGAVDFCRLYYHYTTITNCARNGALWASDPLAPKQSQYASVQAAALADANSLSPALTAGNVTSSNSTDAQGNPLVTVTVSYQFQMLTSVLGFSSVNMARQVTMRVAQATPN